MKNRKLINFALLCLSTGIVLCGAGYFMGGKGITMNNKMEVLNEMEYLEFTNMDMESFKSLEVAITNCDVKVIKSADNKYGVDIRKAVSDANEEIVWIEDNVLHIEVEEKGLGKWFSFNFDFKDKEEYVHIYVPEEEYKNFDISTTNSKIEIDGVKIEELMLETSNADIELKDIFADNIEAETSNDKIKLYSVNAKKAVLDTSNGNIELEDVGIDDVEADTSNSNIKISDAYGTRLMANTTNGNIEINKVNFSKSLEADTSNGRIKLIVDGSQEDFEIEADTTNDNIYIDGKKSGKNYEDGNGSSKISLNTTNGKIEIKFD